MSDIIQNKAHSIILQADLNSISPAEAIIKAKEDTRKQASARHIPDQALLENRDMARGQRMEPSELIARIEKLNRRILIRKGGVRNAVAVYVPVEVSEDHPHGLKYTTGFYIDAPLPEFSSVTVDNMGVAHKEIRGWRSVLLALIEAGALNRKKVDLLFGPATGQRTDLWYRGLQANEKN